MENSTQKLIQILLSQIEARDKEIELQIIRNKEKNRKHNNTTRILILFLIISFVSNLLSIIYF